jgi:hypothetical protein
MSQLPHVSATPCLGSMSRLWQLPRQLGRKKLGWGAAPHPNFPKQTGDSYPMSSLTIVSANYFVELRLKLCG